MMRAALTLAVLLASPFAAASDCEWLPVAEIDRAFAEFAPWEAYSTGQARCDFTSRSAASRHSMTFSRTWHDSPDAAQAAAAGLAKALAGLFEPEKIPSLGAEGFTGQAKIEGGELLNFTGHRDRMLIEVRIGFSSGIREPHRPAGLALAERVLGTGAQFASTQDLAQCPHLDVALLRPRMPAVRVSLPAEGMCVVRSGALVLTFESREQGQADDLIQYLIDGTCSSEPVPALGASARLAWGCGQPETRLLQAEGRQLLTWELRTGAESTPADRAWLASVAAQRAATR